MNVNPWRFPDGFTIDDVKDYHGFCYIIKCHVNQRQYIGKKSFTRGSAWQNYFGSSDDLTSDIAMFGQDQFVRTIVSLHHSAADLSYAEARLQFQHNCLHATFEDGTPRYYNKVILARVWKRTIKNPATLMALYTKAKDGPLDW